VSTVLITGGHTGIGLACVNELASVWRANVILAGRSPDKMEAVAREVHERFGVRVDTLSLDVGSLASVRAAAKQLRSWRENGKLESLDALICNAGAQFHGPVPYSPEGYEQTFAVNYLGNFLLVHLLLDELSDGGRVVHVASGTHDPDTMDGKMIGGVGEPDADMLASVGKDGHKVMSPLRRYSTSKLCVMLFAYELDRRLRRASPQAMPIASIAFEPGYIPETGLVREGPDFFKRFSRSAFGKWLVKVIGVTIGDVQLSGAAMARAAIDPACAQSSGKYLQPKDGRHVEARSSKTSYDEAKAQKLWQQTERLVALRPEERPTRLQGQGAS
jgi:NAD(P)-dependent dehydrogenase (short-subunit alcohol dehydrogenase family)